jgi:PAS domain-containing protein
MDSDETVRRKQYEPPSVTRVTADSLPEDVRTELGCLVWEATSGKDELGISGSDCRVLLSIEGRFKQVSQEFCSLIGYEEKELIGKRIDEVTAVRTSNIPQHLGAVVHFGNFHNLWMFMGRTGRAIVVRCDWELFPDSTIVIFCQPIRRDH